MEESARTVFNTIATRLYRSRIQSRPWEKEEVSFEEFITDCLNPKLGYWNPKTGFSNTSLSGALRGLQERELEPLDRYLKAEYESNNREGEDPTVPDFMKDL